jgi:hypothetical protein
MHDTTLARVQAEYNERLKKLEFDLEKDKKSIERKIAGDQKTLSLIIEIFDESDSIGFLREHDFGGLFNREYIKPLNEFVYVSKNPDQKMLIEELEDLRIQLVDKATNLSKLLGLKTHPRKGTFSSVLPEEYQTKIRPKWVDEAANEINDAATEFVNLYEEFIHKARSTLG